MECEPEADQMWRLCGGRAVVGELSWAWSRDAGQPRPIPSRIPSSAEGKGTPLGPVPPGFARPLLGSTTRPHHVLRRWWVRVVDPGRRTRSGRAEARWSGVSGIGSGGPGLAGVKSDVEEGPLVGLWLPDRGCGRAWRRHGGKFEIAHGGGGGGEAGVRR